MQAAILNGVKRPVLRPVQSVDVSCYNPDAVRFCPHGALVRVCENFYLTRKIAIMYLLPAARALGHDGIIDLSEATDHATVMKMYDGAILLAMEEALL